MKKEPEDTEKNAAEGNLDPLPEPQEHNKDVISYRRPRPGETFLGGRGVILGTPIFSGRGANRRSKDEEEFKQRALRAFDKVLKEEAEAQFSAPPIDENDSATSPNSHLKDEEQEMPYRRPPKGWNPRAEASKFEGKKFGPTLSQIQPQEANPGATASEQLMRQDLERVSAEHVAIENEPGPSIGIRLLEVLSMASFVALQIGAVVLWIWSIFLAFKAGGLIAAFVTVVIPVLSQVYWAWALWPSAFSQVFLLWVLISLIPPLIAMLGAAFGREK